MKKATQNLLNEGDRLRWATLVANFVKTIGISVEMAESSDTLLPDTFLENIRVVQGGLMVDMARVFPGDILHEAGHLAIIPQHFRPLAVGSLNLVNEAMNDYMGAHPEGLMTYPEDPLCRGILQTGESEATAWQYAAAQAIGLPDEWLFPKHAYDGDAQDVLDSLHARAYFGINGLQAAGWTVLRKNPYKALPVYPELAFWLHPGVPVLSSTEETVVSV